MKFMLSMCGFNENCDSLSCESLLFCSFIDIPTEFTFLNRFISFCFETSDSQGGTHALPGGNMNVFGGNVQIINYSYSLQGLLKKSY